jgi:hypothetical protein
MERSAMIRTVSGLIVTCVLVACAPAPSADSLQRASTGTGSAGAGGAGGGGSVSGTGLGTGFGGTGATGFIPAGGAVDPGGGGACAVESQTAEDVIVEVPVEIVTYDPIALFIMLDRSGSMVTGFPPPASPDSWNNSVVAITAFVNDPASEGIDVGLGTFPFGPDNTASCDGADCGQAIVPIAPLPGNASPMITALQQNAPSNPIALTPTECALRGMINQCAAFMAQSPTGERCVAILVTDGNPTQCDTNQQNLINIVAAGAAQGVLTFTLALPGANIVALNELATAGGTDCDPAGPNTACDAQGGASAFIDALNQIRGQVVTTTIVEEIQSTTLECTWAIPQPPEGETLDPNQVNVDFSSGGGAPQPIGKVPSKEECANYQGGWFYEADNPHQISVCDESCGVIKAAQNARIDILLGCETIVSPPR